MSDAPTLDKLITVSSRFGRSVSLIRDAHRLNAIDGYILTPTGRDVLRRNERSLFAFLTSSEPFGFQEFLRETPLKGGVYRLDHLYDYVMASLRP